MRLLLALGASLVLVAGCGSADSLSEGVADSAGPSVSTDYYGISLEEAFLLVPCRADTNYNWGTPTVSASHCTKYGGEQWVYVYPDAATQESAKEVRGCGGHLELPGLVICTSSLDVGQHLQTKLGGELT